MAQKRTSKRPHKSIGLTRRQFLAYASATGLLAGLPPGLNAWAADQATAVGRRRPIERRTLFFNFAHEADAATARYFLVVGGRRHRLRRLKTNDPVLKRLRRTNTFLQGVPDSALTHVVQHAALPADAVQLGYVVKNPNVVTGTWAMSSMALILPSSAIASAYERVREQVSDGPLPLSAKRKLYGHGPAQSLQDLLDEQAVQDPTDHAGTLIGLHPALLSGEPNSAAHIQCNYIATNGVTFALSTQIQALGDAQPQQTPDQLNSSGWATLVPLTDDNDTPIRNQSGNNKGLIQYFPDWNSSQIDPLAGQAMMSIQPQVNNDPTLGADITGLTHVTQDVGMGKVWARHDGFTTVDQSPTVEGAVQDTVKWTLNDKSLAPGLNVTVNVQPQSNGSIQVTVTYANWYLRYLEAWLSFLDASNQVIPVSKLSPNPLPNNNPDNNLPNSLFAAVVPPEFTVLAIPLDASYATVTFTVPPAASVVRILASGAGSLSVPAATPPLDAGLERPGLLLTLGINFGLSLLFLAAGASPQYSFYQKAFVLPIAQTLAAEFISLMGAIFAKADPLSDPGTWKALGVTLFKSLLNAAAGTALRTLVVGLVQVITVAALEDAIPVAGQILRAVAAAVGVADILHTGIDIGLSPPTYIYELVLTHDLSVTIKPDIMHDTFPAVADYYKVTALFDGGGTPHVQTLNMPGGTVSSLPPVVFKNVPRGGQVNLSVGFYSRSSDPAQTDWLAGNGTTGLVDNTVDTAPDITITEYPVPIQSTTVYEHKQKTVLDAQGNHTWLVTAQGSTTTARDISCEGAGTLCDFRSITVRQGTKQQRGYVGYAWQGYSTGVDDCSGGGQGQLDQVANLGAATPQSGYVTAPCGFPQGVKLTYSLLTHGTANFYLDTTLDPSSGSSVNLVRQVVLDPTPQFANPAELQAWGKLNFDSTDLLLHPTGKLVSINNAENFIETLQIPATPLSDADATTRLLAQVHAGQGSRPGLISGPCAAAVSPDGVILILEDQNNRLQAFDLGGNPVQFFSKQQSPYFLNLDVTESGDTVYLDLAVEFTGYLYVLSYNQSTNLYRLDIYHPGQSDTMPLSTTLNVNAAKLTVDFWRNVYTLNYELLRLPNGMVPAITEPSVSLWAPSTP